MADIKAFPSRHLDTLRHGYNKFIKSGASMGEWAKLIEGLPQEDVDFLTDRRSKDFPGLNPSRVLKSPKDQADFDEATRKRKQLRTPPGTPHVIKGDAIQSPPKSKLRSVDSGKTYSNMLETPKVSKSGFKWGSIAKGAGKVLGGAVGVAAEVAFPTKLNVGEDEWLRKQRNTYANKVSLGILD